MNIGMVRKIDDLGRIVVPAETRRLFNISEGDELAISVVDDAIVIRRLEAVCVFCGATDDVVPFRNRGLCTVCLAEVADAGGVRGAATAGSSPDGDGAYTDGQPSLTGASVS